MSKNDPYVQVEAQPAEDGTLRVSVTSPSGESLGSYVLSGEGDERARDLGERLREVLEDRFYLVDAEDPRTDHSEDG